jgi:xanthine dehydrogenase accessory factor
MLTSPSILYAEPPIHYCAVMTDDSETILRFTAEGAEGDFGSALVTLVEIRGGASRALGTHMAVRGDGRSG